MNPTETEIKKIKEEAESFIQRPFEEEEKALEPQSEAKDVKLMPSLFKLEEANKNVLKKMTPRMEPNSMRSQYTELSNISLLKSPQSQRSSEHKDRKKFMSKNPLKNLSPVGSGRPPLSVKDRPPVPKAGGTRKGM